MTAQEYIQSKLDELKKPLDLEKPSDDQQLEEAIFKIVTSKKFRKYSVNPEYVEHMRSAIKLCVEKHEPIKFTLVFGGYKLWRLDESPEVDWAELFAFIYYANWLNPICEIYKPGVWFDFFSDDAIVSRIDNVPSEDLNAYQRSFKDLIDFIKPYLPDNFLITFNRVGDQYKTEGEFNADVEANIELVQKSLGGKFPTLTDEMKATLDLNVKLSPDQTKDPLWREKVQLVHDGYAQISGRRPYYRTDDKIMVITRPIPNSLAVGTTKDSVMKFWVGAGVLKPRDSEFRQIIMSPGQLEKANFNWENVDIGLSGNNFREIRILKD